jgi:hypothetical protein
MPANKLDEFVEDVFRNTLDLRECNRRLVDIYYPSRKNASKTRLSPTQTFD